MISETFVDGVIAAFYANAPNARAVAQALAPKLPGISPDELEQLVGSTGPARCSPVRRSS